jgi:hypothetical protein
MINQQDVAMMLHKAYPQNKTEIDKCVPLTVGEAKTLQIAVWTFQKRINCLLHAKYQQNIIRGATKNLQVASRSHA